MVELIKIDIEFSMQLGEDLVHKRGKNVMTKRLDDRESSE